MSKKSKNVNPSLPKRLARFESMGLFPNGVIGVGKAGLPLIKGRGLAWNSVAVVMNFSRCVLFNNLAAKQMPNIVP